MGWAKPVTIECWTSLICSRASPLAAKPSRRQFNWWHCCESRLTQQRCNKMHTASVISAEGRRPGWQVRLAQVVAVQDYWCQVDLMLRHRSLVSAGLLLLSSWGVDPSAHSSSHDWAGVSWSLWWLPSPCQHRLPSGSASPGQWCKGPEWWRARTPAPGNQPGFSVASFLSCQPFLLSVSLAVCWLVTMQLLVGQWCPVGC